MATESKHFINQLLQNLNPIANGKAEWQKDEKLTSEVNEAFERVASDLNTGILQHYLLARE